MRSELIFKVAAYTTLFLTLWGCGQVNDMHDATMEMNKSTKKLLELTQKVSDLSQHMSDNMDDVRSKTADMHDNMKLMQSETHEMAQGMKDQLTLSQQMLQEMKSMAKLTSEMSVEMASMLKSTDVLKMLTKKMYDKLGTQLNLTLGLFNDSQINEAGKSRGVFMDKLLGAVDLDAKYGYAGMYNLAFDFQFWKPGLQTEEQRQTMFKNAVMEYLTTVKDLAWRTSDTKNSLMEAGVSGGFLHMFKQWLTSFPDSHVISDLSNYEIVVSGSNNENYNRRQSLFTILASMEMVGDTQLFALKGTKIKPANMLALFEDGLAARADVKSGKIKDTKNLPRYIQEILKKEQVALFYVQLRQTFLRGAVYDGLAQQDDGNQYSHALSLYRSYANTRWTPHLDARNNAQIEMAAEYLELAKKTADFLISIGEKPVRSSVVDNLYQNMDLHPFVLDKSPRGRSLQRFVNAVNASYPNRNYK